MTSSVKKNTSYLSISQFSRFGLAFLLILFAPRYLGDELFGYYSLATTLMYLVLLCNDLGINTLLIREIARDKERAGSYAGNAIALKLMLIFPSLLVIVIAFHIYDLPPSAKAAIIIFAIFGILSSFNELFRSIYRAFERMKYEALIVILEKIIATSLGICVLVFGFGLVPFSFTFVIGGIVAIFLGLFILRRHFFRPAPALDVSVSKWIILNSIPLGLSMFIVTSYTKVDILILSAFMNSDVVGWYSAAYRLITVTSLIPNVLVGATFPRMSQQVVRMDKDLSVLFTKGFKYLFYIAVPLIVGTIIVSDKIVLLLFGSEFINSGQALRILAWVAGINFFNIFFTGLLWASNNQKKLVFINIGGLLINIMLNYFLIPRYAHIGASIAALVTECFIFFVCALIAFRGIVAIREYGFVFRSLLSVVVMASFLLIFHDLNLLLSIFIAVVLYLSVLYALGGFNLEEVMFDFRKKEHNASSK